MGRKTTFWFNLEIFFYFVLQYFIIILEIIFFKKVNFLNFSDFFFVRMVGTLRIYLH